MSWSLMTICLFPEALEHLTYLHNIGKIGIPDAILLKPGKLRKHETAIM
jgi:putative two-component system response regulator